MHALPGIRIAIGKFDELSDERLRFATQFGVSDILLNTPRIPGDERWEEADLRRLVDRCAEYGLRLSAIENVPLRFWQKAMLGLPGRDEQIEHFRETVRNMGRAGIPILGYNFKPNGVWRTSRATQGRGGALVTSFNLDLVVGSAEEQRAFVSPLDRQLVPIRVSEDQQTSEPAITADEMWANYEYFIRAVLPVAEEAGVKLALHPDDPPVETLGGVARIFHNVAGFKRASEIVPSPAWGLDLCLGSCSEMTGGAVNVMEMIDYFGPRDCIAYVHFRDVQGTVPTFQECFLGEGNYDPAAVLLALQRVGFSSFILDDHVPVVDDDTPWSHRGRAHAIGYMQGLLKMMEHVA